MSAPLPVERPPLGARVRVLAGTGIPGVAGLLGIVEAYHADGVAIIVRLAPHVSVVVEPQHVEVAP
jgi:hypothetical protein